MGLLTVVSLFSGCGGLDLSAHLAGGFRTISYCEANPYRQGILMSLMRQGALDTAPIHNDVRTLDATGFRGLVDVVAGGDPCQPHSLAGKRKGLQDDRWLWPHFKRIINECQPRFVLRENVPGTVSSGGLIAVLEDLEGMGYKAVPYKISAAEVGAWHLRERIFIIAHLNQDRGRVQQKHGEECEGPANHKHDGKAKSFSDDSIIRRSSWWPECEAWGRKRKNRNGDKDYADADKTRKLQQKRIKQDQRISTQRILAAIGSGHWWDSEPGVGRVVHGCPHRVDRIGSLGDIVVPQQALPLFKKIVEASQETMTKETT